MCDLSPKAECVLDFAHESERGHLWEKLKIGMRNGLEQRCGGNFLAIFVGMGLGEKPNFTGGFFEWRRPFDFSTDRL